MKILFLEFMIEEYKQKWPNHSFIPHFPLIKENRLTTKIRIIYMANLAQKNLDGSQSLSINDCVHSGFSKNHKIALAFTLMRFDLFLLAYDMSKAFHQLAISEENSSKFLFFWFKNVAAGDFTPIVYKFDRVIFGLTCAPFLLTCALYKMLIENSKNDSEILRELKTAIYHGSYADNIYVTCNDFSELKFSYNESIKIFQQHNMPLQQFLTNHSEFQEELKNTHNENPEKQVKLLGMLWERESDNININKVHFNENANTKRQIVACINSAYDLINLHLPILNRARIFCRELNKNNWDDNIGPENSQKWRLIARQYNSYSQAGIPRMLGNKKSSYTLIILSDASKDFIGMVAYLKENKTNNINFLMSHNQLLNQVMRGRTMPVLEFSAIEFAVRKSLEFYESITSTMVPISISDIKLLTDSTIALSWLNKSENLHDKLHKKSSFLKNKISSIVNLCTKVKKIEFAHIGTKVNMADFTTRIVSPKVFSKSKFWKGPDFLATCLKNFEWITVPNPEINNQNNLPKFSINALNIEPKKSLNEILDFKKYSSFEKMVRIFKTVAKFIFCLKSKIYREYPVKYRKYENICLNNLSYEYCKNEIIKAEQQLNFPEIFEFFSLPNSARKNIPMLINQFNIVIDKDDGILKVKSKMSKLNNKKFCKIPILLKKDSNITKSIINDCHIKYNHSGVYFCLNQLKSQYFILKAFSAVKSTLQNCFHCKKVNSRPVKNNANDYKPWMVEPRKQLFNSCFIDYFGPYYVWYGESKIKAYCLIFKCIWSKIINIEVVLSADSKSFILALQNHIYDYGMPAEIRSDSGSCFSGAYPYIKDVLETVEVGEYLNRYGIKNVTLEQYPKGSLNRGIGGIIENSVGLLKRMLFGAIKNNVLDFVEFCHIVKQCVSYANKRPISDKSCLRDQDVNAEFLMYTPELLKFGYETCIVELNTAENFYGKSEDLDVEEINKLIKVKDKIRENYYSEFLYSLLDQATKYKNKYTPVHHVIINVGDVVIIKEPNMKSIHYPIGVVLEIVKNSLGEVTQAKIFKSNRNVIYRDISTLILLVKNNTEKEDDSNNKSVLINNPKNSNKKGNSNFLNNKVRSSRNAARKCNNKRKNLINEGLL
jgi:hypothetical protein